VFFDGVPEVKVGKNPVRVVSPIPYPFDITAFIEISDYSLNSSLGYINVPGNITNTYRWVTQKTKQYMRVVRQECP
jgi:hypothetical protein